MNSNFLAVEFTNKSRGITVETDYTVEDLDNEKLTLCFMLIADELHVELVEVDIGVGVELA